MKIVLLAAAALSVLLTNANLYGADPGAFKLEGAWIARVQTLSLVPGVSPLPFQWSYVLAPDASGRSASLHGSVDVAFPPMFAFDFLTPLIGEIVQTGPNTASFNSFWCFVQMGSQVDRIAYIGRSWGQIVFVGPGKSEVAHHFEIYSSEADVNGDGLPEGDPIFSFTATSSDTRIPSPALNQAR